MKYRVLVRKWETVARDVEIDVEASGRRLAEEKAVAIARGGTVDDQFGPPSGGHDVSYEPLAVGIIPRKEKA